MLFAVLMADAYALTSKQGGPSLDLGLGLGLGVKGIEQTSFAPKAGGHLALGWWTGTYDDQYSFGKYWWFGSSTRIDIGSGLTLAPMFEIRRGLELIVVGLHPFIGGGPLVVAADETMAVGWTARAGVGGKFRRSRFWGITVRMEGGVDGIEGGIHPTAGLLFGAAFARPAHEITGPAP